MVRENNVGATAALCIWIWHRILVVFGTTFFVKSFGICYLYYPQIVNHETTNLIREQTKTFAMEGMEVETSLDVLSRAASLVETETDAEIIKARPVDSKCCVYDF